MFDLFICNFAYMCFIFSSIVFADIYCVHYSYYAALPRGRLKCCIPSVCPSVRPVSPIFSKPGSRRNLQFVGNIALDKSNYECKFKTSFSLKTVFTNFGFRFGQDHWKQGCVNRFSRKCSSKRSIFVKIRSK